MLHAAVPVAGWATTAARKVSALDYMNDVVVSFGDRRVKYAGTVISTEYIRDFLVALTYIEGFIQGHPVFAMSVNSAVGNHPPDDVQFTVKVIQQLCLINVEQTRIQPQAVDALRCSVLIAEAVRMLGVIGTVIAQLPRP